MALDDILAKEQTWILSAAIRGAKPHYEQLASMEKYAKKNDAKIAIIPVQGQFDEQLHPDLFQYEILGGNHKLGKNIEVRSHQILAQQINPLTGLRRFGQTHKSYIIGSPKQQLEHVPNSPKYYPKAIMSTGACTLPLYKDNRIGMIGQGDHKQGGVIVKIFEDDTFIFRHFVCNKDGSFVDYDTLYTPKTTKKVRVDSLVLGDLHDDMKDETAYNASLQQIKDLKPKHIFLHDVFDGASINHHEKQKVVTRTSQWNKRGLTLENELLNLYQTLTEIYIVAPKDSIIYIVKSNHDEFLNKYLEDGDFVKDTPNAQLGFKIAYALSQGNDPLKYGLELLQGKLPNRIKFLQRDDDIRRFGYLLSSHGDKGPNGVFGSMNNLEYSVGKGFVGHNHSSAILRDIYRVGTLSILNPNYTKGSPSNWTHTNGSISFQGKPQLLPIINHRYS